MDRLPASAMPTLRQLQFLTAIRAHGSFVAAAEAVGVTQPSLSAGIKELETQLGVVLVDRGRSGAVLTPAGLDVAERASRALAEVEDLVRAARADGQPFATPFRVGAIPTIAPFLLPKALPFLQKRFPGMRLHLREDQTARLLEQVRARVLDAAVIALPYPIAGLASQAIGDDEFLLLTPTDHPLARRDALGPEDLDVRDLLLLEDGHCLRDHALEACGARAGGVRTGGARDDVSATSLHTLAQMVAAGMGVTLLPRLAAESGLAPPALATARPFDEPLIGRSIGVVWREGGARAREAKLLADGLADALKLAAGPMAALPS